MKRHKKITGCIFLIGCFICSVNLVLAQKKDNATAIMQEYVKLWRIYDQKPLQLKLSISNTASPVTKEGDTLHAEMDYYLNNHLFYLQSEGLEEFVNDSMIILVNHEVKKMLLYRNNTSVDRMMRKYSETFMRDSSVEKLVKEYSAEKTEMNKMSNRIVLTSKTTVGGTSLPKEQIDVQYKVAVYEPVELIQIRRTLVPVDADYYQRLKTDPAYTGKLVESKTESGRLYFIVKEYTALYSFKKISHNTDMPVKESERVVMNDKGEYVPAKGYEEFTVEKEF